MKLIIHSYTSSVQQTGEFPAQRASNAENVSIWWRHHVWHIPGAAMWDIPSKLVSNSASKIDLLRTWLVRHIYELELAFLCKF